MITPETDPEHIAISRSTGIQIDWKDGHHSTYSNALLRDECPCALCTGAHGTPPERTNFSSSGGGASPFQMYKPAPKMAAVEPAGGYALKIFWNDGHSGGLYSWEHLRKICPCKECRAKRDE